MLGNYASVFQHSSATRLLVLSLALFCLVYIPACSSGGRSSTIHLPSGSISPSEVDRDFLAEVDDLVTSGRGATKIVCILRLYAANDESPFGNDVERLQGLGRHALIVRAPAAAIHELTKHPHLAWIGEYRPEYKYNKTLAGARVAWVYIESFRGDRFDFRREMEAIGLSQIHYISVPGRYYAKANGHEIVELATLWWVKNIYRAHRRGLLW